MSVWMPMTDIASRIDAIEANQARMVEESGKAGNAADNLPTPSLPPGALNYAEKVCVRAAFDTLHPSDIKDASDTIHIAFNTTDESQGHRRSVLSGVHACLRVAHLHDRGMRFHEAVRCAENGIDTRDMTILDTRSDSERSADALLVRRIAAPWLEAL